MKGADPPFAIKLNNPYPVQFCTEPVLIAKEFTIEGTPSIQGMKISFSEGYKLGEDELVYAGKLTASWPTPGTLMLTGGINFQDYVDDLRSISYKNNKAIPTLGTRKITISLNDVDYLPETQHFYRFVEKPNFKWTDADAEAKSDAMMYYGLRGYLATITSQVESDFIKQKTKGVGWIGASDAGTEGEWRWVTGPEGLLDNGKGLQFWKGTGYLAKTNPTLYGPVNGAFHNWNRWNVPYSSSVATSNWEPNQSGDEDYAHITVFPSNLNDSYKWNDLPNIGGNGDYASKGYLIEFGGSPNDPVLNLTATIELQVNTVLFKTGTITPICEGLSTMLSQEDKNPIPGSYLWSPEESLSSPSIANPVASPNITTTYLVTGTRGTCTNTATYTVPIIPKPISLLKPEENICKGQTIKLDPGVHPGYTWSNGATTQTITVGVAGSYDVKLNSDKGCPGTFVTKVIIHDYPTIDLSKLEKLICSNAKATTVNITTNAAGFALESGNLKATVNGLEVNVPDFGIYPMVFKAIDLYCLSESKFDLAFYKPPTINLGNDTTICNPANIKLNVVPLYASYLWSTNETTSGIIVRKDGIYDVKITDKNGCKTNDEIKVSFTDKPKMDLSKLETLICGKFTTTVNIPVDKNVTWFFESKNPKVKISGLTASVSPSDFGTYPVTIIAKDEYSCSTTNAFNLGFYKIPKVDFTIDAKKCSGYNLNARYVGDAETVVSNFKWIFGRDTIGNKIGLNSLVVPLGINRSQRDLSLTVTQDGCPNTYTQKDIKVIPNLNLSIVDSIGCEPFKAEFIAENTEVVVYDWDFGDGTPIERKDKQPSHIYQSDGFYDVKLKITTIVTNGEGCVNEVKIDSMVYVAPIPTVGFTPLPVVCLEKVNQSISYLGSGDTLDRYIWNLTKLDNDEIIQNPKETQGPLVFNLKNKPQTNIGLKVISKYGCQSSDASVFVKRKPDFTIRSSSPAGCTPFVPLFTAKAKDTVDKLSYSWNFGDGDYGKGDSIKHTYNIPNQKYDIVLKAISSTTGCTDSLFSKAFVQTYPIPTAGFTPLAAECLEKGHNQISYKGTGDQLDTYNWNLANFDNDEIIQNPNKTQGPFVFDLKNKPQTNIRLNVISKYGCKSDTATVLVKRKPDFSISTSSNAGCTPFEPSFIAKTSDRVDKVDYSWDFGDGTTGSGIQVKHEYREPNQKYDVVLAALSSTTGCTDTLRSKEFVWVYPKPKAAFTMDNKIVYNDKPTVNFTNQSIEAEEYYWDFGDKLTSDLKDPSHYYKVPGYRTVLLEVFNQYQCSDTISDRLLVAFDRIFAPTGFSPNAPNMADREFRLGSEGIATDGYHLTILSRWNDIVFEIKDEVKGWRGLMSNGSLAPAGVYLWILNFTDFLGRTHRQTGTVTLVY